MSEISEDGSVLRIHEVPQDFTMMLPTFHGVAAVHGIEGLTNPQGFIFADKHQSNPICPEISGIGVCIAIPPKGKTPVQVGVPKTGFMIESMVTATAQNIVWRIAGKQPNAVAPWNAVCFANFGDAAKERKPGIIRQMGACREIGFENYFLHKVRTGKSETHYKKRAPHLLGIEKLKAIEVVPACEHNAP